MKNSVIRRESNYNSLPEYFIDSDKKISNTDEVANTFNTYFVNIGPKLAADINISHIKLDIGSDQINSNSFFLTATDEKEIINTVNKCKAKQSSDHDDLDTLLIKQVINEIVKPLCHIYNLSFTMGEFPNHMKIAKITPIYKNGDKHQFSNYRPISVLSQFSKILEKLFTTRLDNFIEKYNILNDNQYGFRSNRSTTLALIDLVEEITNNIDKKRHTMGIFIDLKKALDTIDHDILLRKLE